MEYKKLKEVSFKIVNKLLILIGIVITIEQTITSFLYELIRRIPLLDNKNNINLLMYLILGIGFIYILVHSIREVFSNKAVIKIKAENDPKIIVKLGNYEENMEEVLDNIKLTDKDVIFVIGINDEISMSKAQKRGVHKSVIDKFYGTEEKFNLFQKETIKAFSNISSTKENFGQVGFVKHDDNSNIMFVINSKNGKSERECITGPQPTEIIKKIFKELEPQTVDIVQMPIISSKNVVCCEDDKIRFSVTIVEIIEEYFKQILNNKNINYDLVLSIRKEDLDTNSITLNTIVKFIEELKPLYHIK